MRSAAYLIERVHKRLDTSTQDCGTCGRPWRNNLVEARAGEKIAGLPEKLRVIADNLERGSE